MSAPEVIEQSGDKLAARLKVNRRTLFISLNSSVLCLEMDLMGGHSCARCSPLLFREMPTLALLVAAQVCRSGLR